MILDEVVHWGLGQGKGLTGCCHRPVTELPGTDKVTADPAAVTCGTPAEDEDDDAYPVGPAFMWLIYLACPTCGAKAKQPCADSPFGPHKGRPARWEHWTPTVASGQTVAELSLDEWVGQALGAASACWANLAGAGEFDSTRCRRILDGLMAHLNEVIGGVVAGTTKAVTPASGEPLLGLATTREMLREIEVRAAVGRLDDEQRAVAPQLLRLEQVASGLQAGLPPAVLDYRTAGS